MQSDNEESVLPLILLLIRLFLPTFSGPRRLSIPAPLAAAAGLIAFLSFFSTGIGSHLLIFQKKNSVW